MLVLVNIVSNISLLICAAQLFLFLPKTLSSLNTFFISLKYRKNIPIYLCKSFRTTQKDSCKVVSSGHRRRAVPPRLLLQTCVSCCGGSGINRKYRRPTAAKWSQLAVKRRKERRAAPATAGLGRRHTIAADNGHCAAPGAAAAGTTIDHGTTAGGASCGRYCSVAQDSAGIRRRRRQSIGAFVRNGAGRKSESNPPPLWARSSERHSTTIDTS